jgi:hypothetical protein
MACFFPSRRYVLDSGEHVWSVKSGMNVVDEIWGSCRQCEGCRKQRAAAWALRCRHELRSHRESAFLTLTYDDDHLPPGNSLRYSDVQKFFKRVRVAGKPFRFVGCGEYGDQYGRAHYHAIVFGQDFKDDAKLISMQGGNALYSSDWLSEKWGLGFVSVGSVTPQSIGYVTSYCMDKVTGKGAPAHYGCEPFVDADTGEIRSMRTPEFLRMSLRPGIGAEFADKFAKDFQHGYAVADGRKVPIPKYYRDRFAEGEDIDLAVALEHSQLHAALLTHTPQFLADNTLERLAVRRQVDLAKPFFQRSLAAKGGVR